MARQLLSTQTLEQLRAMKTYKEYKEMNAQQSHVATDGDGAYADAFKYDVELREAKERLSKGATIAARKRQVWS